MTIFTRGARRSRPAILLVAAALVLGACGRGPDQRFAAEPAARADVVERVSAPGSVQPNAAADVTAPSAGTLGSLVRDGAKVKKGQVVARISSPEVEDAVRQAEAAAGAASSLGAVPSLPTGQAIAAFDQVQEQISASTKTVLDALRAALPQLPAADRPAARKKIDAAEKRIDKAQAASAEAARAAAASVQATGAAVSGALA
jgi:multidrug efflux pump subunit AcrA (membrane-fusion protein)